MPYLRKYNKESRVYFSLFRFAIGDLFPGATIAAGDAQISKDGAAFANIVGEADDDLFVDEGGGVYSLKLAAVETQCATALIKIVDQTNPKEWEDCLLVLETHSHDSAQHQLYPEMTCADIKINTGVSPWEKEYYEKGTDTLIMAKKMYSKDGAEITSVRATVGQLLENAL